MYNTTLRNVGGSVMFAIPKPLLEGLGFKSNQQVGVSISDGRLIVEAKAKPKYSLDELLAECDINATLEAQEIAWLEDSAIGNEII